MVRILSSEPNSPKNSPLPSEFKRCTVSSNQILRAERVETPFSFSSILAILYFVTRFPLAPLPLMANSEKSISNFSFLTLAFGRSFTNTVSASPLGLAENQSTLELVEPLVKSYSLSLVIEVTSNLFM